ncbi:ankyrin repeat domain-containing protein, partial [bacterium]|nr:ankyrin repeat domain-containing protein [bacterium]
KKIITKQNNINIIKYVIEKDLSDFLDLLIKYNRLESDSFQEIFNFAIENSSDKSMIPLVKFSKKNRIKIVLDEKKIYMFTKTVFESDFYNDLINIFFDEDFYINEAIESNLLSQKDKKNILKKLILNDELSSKRVVNFIDKIDDFSKDDIDNVIFISLKNDNLNLFLKLIDIKYIKLDRVFADGKNILMFAAENGSVKIINWLINYNFDLNATDNDGNTALDYAFQYDPCVHLKKREIITELLHFKAKRGSKKISEKDILNLKERGKLCGFK